ncbi:MAG: mandelate racemase/muconate lactonizing enzyme family protein [Opitutaceae bacterium]|nr:mandelate racemase/muconate lactonizing enzyme family protein [Opitutaceae bacterium]
MKIKHVFAKQIDFPMGGKVWNPALTFNAKEIVFIFVETDTGILGVSEVWSFYGSARSIVDTINHDIAPLVTGEDPHFTERIRHRIAGIAPIGTLEGVLINALSGLDNALWDLRAKLLNTPLYQLLGAYSDSVYTYASGGLYGRDKTIDDLKAEVTGYIDQGFSGVKIKIGGVPQRDDLERISVTREAIGPDARLMIDAVHAYNVPEALSLAAKAQQHDIYWFESPIALADNAGHAVINARAGIPVCANESLYGCQNFNDLISRRGTEYVHLDLCACGGITEARKISAIAEAHGLPVTLHSANSVCLFSASINFSATLSQCDSVEYHQVHQWLRAYAPEATMALTDGPYVKPLEAPGIGMDFITPDFIDKIAAEIASDLPAD